MSVGVELSSALLTRHTQLYCTTTRDVIHIKRKGRSKFQSTVERKGNVKKCLTNILVRKMFLIHLANKNIFLLKAEECQTFHMFCRTTE